MQLQSVFVKQRSAVEDWAFFASAAGKRAYRAVSPAWAQRQPLPHPSKSDPITSGPLELYMASQTQINAETEIPGRSKRGEPLPAT